MFDLNGNKMKEKRLDFETFLLLIRSLSDDEDNLAFILRLFATSSSIDYLTAMIMITIVRQWLQHTLRMCIYFSGDRYCLLTCVS